MRHRRLAGIRAGRRARIGSRGRLAAAGAAALVAVGGTAVIAAPPASASTNETVIVTSSGLLSPVTAVLQVLGTVLTQFHLIDAVEASIPAAVEPLLAALPGWA